CSCVVDIAIDKGGIIETTDRITTHDNPTYEKHGVAHSAVANMAGAVTGTSTLAVANVKVQYAVQMANKGSKEACLGNSALLKGINTLDGYVTFEAVAEAHGVEYKGAKELLEAETVSC
ncbi:alanine dehydrogenase, partial [Bacillus anthracis]|nr:alanine dehydrogenase [Bacillus anthracis]